MNIEQIKRAVLTGANAVSKEQFIKAYRESIKRNNRILYDSNTLELFKHKNLVTFMIDGTYFEVHKEGTHYTTWFTPFNLQGVDIDAAKILNQSGVEVIVHDDYLSLFEKTFDDTVEKSDSFVYNYTGIINHYNGAGRNNSRRKIKKLMEQYEVEFFYVKDLTAEHKKAITDIEQYWLDVLKNGEKFYKFNHNQLINHCDYSSLFDNTFVLLYKNKDTGEYDAYSCTEVMSNIGLEYIRKSKMQGSYYEYMTIVQMNILKEHFNIEQMDFGAARFWYGKKKTDKYNQKLYETKSSLPHEVYWVHRLEHNNKVFQEIKIENSSELF